LEAHSIERKLAAIFAADVEGYSRLMGLDEVGTLRTLNRYRAIIDPLIASYRGRIFNTAGDSILADFASAVDAVQCAVAVQDAIAKENADRPAAEQMQFRIGIHVGDIMVQGDNLFGDAVNIAARLEALAEAGEICVSDAVRDYIGTKLPLAFTDLGSQQVKNIAQPIRAYRIRADTSRTTPVVGSPLPLPDKPSIAVLPFTNMSGDPEQEFFADGMVEEIITALWRIHWLFVIVRNSTFTYKGQAVDVKQVGRELGIRYVLEGSVRKAGQRVRITTQLVDATIGNHVWAEHYDRELADFFAVQDEIAERVVGTIEPELYAAEYLRSQRKSPENLDAWECVIRALAHSLLSWVLLRRTEWSGNVANFFAEAEGEARTALGIDERDSWAHLTHGLVLYRQRRHDEAERAYRRALELNPNFALAYAVLGLPLTNRGAHSEAIESAHRAMRLSPNDPLIDRQATHTMAFTEFAAGHYADCVSWARKTIERHPGHLPPYHVLIAATALLGDAVTAAETMRALFRLRPDFSLTWARKNMPLTGDIHERLLEGLRKAGVPET
jgi:TolB-like protein/class 3 adenylate cyclase